MNFLEEVFRLIDSLGDEVSSVKIKYKDDNCSIESYSCKLKNKED